MDHLTSLSNSYLPEPHASLLNGILLGRPLFVTQTFYDQLKQVGLIHIVVLSGMNITMVSAIVLSSLIPFVGRRVATIITIAIIIGFILFVGAEAPVVRAGIMGVLALVGILFGRKTLTLWLLFLSGLVMVLVNHEWLTSISFQLSFAATLGIILFGTSDKNETENDEFNGNWSASWRMVIGNLKKYLLAELRISLSAQVFTLPIIFWYFRQISFISPLANILVAWLIAPIMILGAISLGVGMINWQAGFILSWLVYSLIHAIVFIVRILSQVPYASVQL